MDAARGTEVKAEGSGNTVGYQKCSYMFLYKRVRRQCGMGHNFLLRRCNLGRNNGIERLTGRKREDIKSGRDCHSHPLIRELPQEASWRR